MNDELKTSADIVLKENTRWKGRYRHIPFEIQRFDMGEDYKNCWTLYIFLSIAQIPQQYKPESFWLKTKAMDYKPQHEPSRLHYDYYRNPIINGIDFHGDCTFYEKYGEKHQRTIKIGCDYQHLHDDYFRCVTDPEHFLGDVKTVIDSVWNLMPELKVRCGTVGGWWSLSEGELNKHGDFVSNAGIEYRKKHYPSNK